MRISQRRRLCSAVSILVTNPKLGPNIATETARSVMGEWSIISGQLLVVSVNCPGVRYRCSPHGLMPANHGPRPSAFGPLGTLPSVPCRGESSWSRQIDRAAVDKAKLGRPPVKIRGGVGDPRPAQAVPRGYPPCTAFPHPHSSRGSIRNSRGDAPLLLESVRQRRQVCHRDLAVLARARALGRSWKFRQVVLATKCPSDFPRPPSSIRRHPHGRPEAWRRPTHQTSLTAQSPSSRREFVFQTTWTSASVSRKSRPTQR
jgi:hypothetical protein